jgi:hypothetical protein
MGAVLKGVIAADFDSEQVRSNNAQTPPKIRHHQGPEDEARHYDSQPCTVCKTSIRGSNPGGASKILRKFASRDRVWLIGRSIFSVTYSLEDRIEANDRTVERRQLGTITLLERWLSASYRKADGTDGSRELVKPWRVIREIRQEPAHSLKPDEYDSEYPAKQDQLLEEALNSLTKLRLALSSFEEAKDYKAPDWLDGDTIVFF